MVFFPRFISRDTYTTYSAIYGHANPSILIQAFYAASICGI